jgi:hypothetical protein
MYKKTPGIFFWTHGHNGRISLVYTAVALQTQRQCCGRIRIRIRIQWGPWIRLRNRIHDLDPDPGGQKLPTNIEKLINFIF